MSTIEKEVLKATGIKAPKAGEDRQKFLLRAMLAMQKLPSDDWETLDQVTQDWYNKAVEADNADKSVPDFPGAPAAEEGAEDDDDHMTGEEDEVADDDGGEEAADEEDEEMPTKTKVKAKAPATKSKPAPKPAAKTAKAVAKKVNSAPAKKAAAAAPAKKGTSMRRYLKRLIVKKPARAVDELIEALEKAGYKSPSRLTVTTIRADTRDTIKVMNEAGLSEVVITDGRAAA